MDHFLRAFAILIRSPGRPCLSSECPSPYLCRGGGLKAEYTKCIRKEGRKGSGEVRGEGGERRKRKMDEVKSAPFLAPSCLPPPSLGQISGLKLFMQGESSRPANRPSSLCMFRPPLLFCPPGQSIYSVRVVVGGQAAWTTAGKCFFPLAARGRGERYSHYPLASC